MGPIRHHYERAMIEAVMETPTPQSNAAPIAGNGQNPPADPPKRARGQHRDGCACTLCQARAIAAEKKTKAQSTAQGEPSPQPGKPSAQSSPPKSAPPSPQSTHSTMARKVEARRKEIAANERKENAPAQSQSGAADPAAKPQSWFDRLTAALSGFQPVIAKAQG